MDQSTETVFQQPPNPPLKRARLDLPWKDEAEEERWFKHMNNVREWHLTQSIYENAMNYLIEETGSFAQTSIEDEAVTMAIRSHGLTQNFAYRVDRALLQFPTTSRGFDSSRDDILSQAVTVAIHKKGLGALDRYVSEDAGEAVSLRKTLKREVRHSRDYEVNVKKSLPALVEGKTYTNSKGIVIPAKNTDDFTIINVWYSMTDIIWKKVQYTLGLKQ